MSDARAESPRSDELDHRPLLIRDVDGRPDRLRAQFVRLGTGTLGQISRQATLDLPELCPIDAVALDSHLAGRPLTPRGHAAVAQAKQLTLGRPSVAGVPPRQGAAIVAASDHASVDAFHWGVGVAGLLVIAGGLIGAVGIQNPRRQVAAEQCSGGQIAGAPLDAAGVHAVA